MRSRLFSLAAASVVLSSGVFAAVIGPGPYLPPPNGMYWTQGATVDFGADVFPAISLSELTFSDFSNISRGDCGTGICDMDFDVTVRAMATIGDAPAVEMLLPNSHLVMHVYGYTTYGIPFNNSFVSLDASGTVAGYALKLGLNPAGGSGGTSDFGGGVYQFTSKPNFFGTISLDGGANWTAATTDVGMELIAQPTPEPGSLALMAGAGCVALFVGRRRRS